MTMTANNNPGCYVVDIHIGKLKNEMASSISEETFKLYGSRTDEVFDRRKMIARWYECQMPNAYGSPNVLITVAVDHANPGWKSVVYTIKLPKGELQNMIDFMESKNLLCDCAVNYKWCSDINVVFMPTGHAL